MQCKCGDETVDSTHSVKTSKKKIEWMGFDNDNEILVNQTVCSGCGRMMVKIFDSVTKELIYSK